MLLLPVIGFSQIIQFGDPDVKAAILQQLVPVDVNGDDEIDQEEAANATYVAIYEMEISSLEGLQYFTNIELLNIYNTNITAIDLSFYPDLKSLNLHSNQITNIDLSMCPLLESLNLSFNPLVELDVQVTPLLEEIDVYETDLISLDLSNLSHLTHAECRVTAFPAPSDAIPINASGCTSLTILNLDVAIHLNLSGCSALTNLTLDVYESIDLSGCSGLTYLRLVTFNMTSVNISDCSSLNYYHIEGDHLETAFLKNGIDEDNHYIFGPILNYICIDETQIQDVVNIFTQNQQVFPILTSQCSTDLGDIVNVITGIVTLDSDSDGCSDADITLNYIRIKSTNGTEERNAFTNTSGTYSLYPNAGTFSLEPIFQNQSLFNFQSQYVTFTEDNGGTATVNFCLTADVEILDADVSVFPIGNAMPGFDSNYQVVVRNRGNQIIDGSIALSYDESVLDYVSSIPQGEASSGAITWPLSTLLPFETRIYNIVLNLNAPTETPPLNINDILTLSAEVTTPADVNPNDNVFGLQQDVVGSFDPNDKVCLQGEIQPPHKIGDFLHYIINFENTGTAAAQFVRVTDEINAEFYDLSSFELLSTSHTALTRLEGNVVEFMFENIDLEPQQHGFASFRIKTNSGLVEGDTVSNQANIYFDYNFPIQTNVASTTFAQLGVSENISGAFRSFPNPVRDILTITAASDIINVALYDVQGRELYNNLGGDQTIYIDMSDQASGVYLAKVTTLDGVQSQKIIKQ